MIITMYNNNSDNIHIYIYTTKYFCFLLQWIPMMEASPWWWSLRRQPKSQEIIRDLLRQMLSALAVLQAANITHRYNI